MSDPCVATRTFEEEDQELFARASGDRNPIHVDALAARLSSAGAPAVHGIHVVLWALDAIAKAGAPIPRLIGLDVRFLKFVHLHRSVSVELLDQSDRGAQVQVTSDGLVRLTLTLRFGDRPRRGDPAVPSTAPARALPARAELHVLADLRELSGWLRSTGDRIDLASAYPHLRQAIGSERIAALAQTSALVGMVAPGLHSIFSALIVTLVDGPHGRECLGFRTLKTDLRFCLLKMAIDGAGMIGEVIALVRPAPSLPPSFDSVRAKVGRDEFSGCSALIVGGSRGLGAVTATLIAAGGGRVDLTYASGQADAERLCERLNEAVGHCVAKALPFDVRKECATQLAQAQLAREGRGVTCLYYFATPKIFRQKVDPFSADLFREFCAFYVDGFAHICEALLAQPPSSALSAFYPSSEAVGTRPRGMTEYAMAKAAGELLCVDLAERFPRLRLSSPRLPRTSTDQTATIARVASQDPVDVMLPWVRDASRAS